MSSTIRLRDTLLDSRPEEKDSLLNTKFEEKDWLINRKTGKIQGPFLEPIVKEKDPRYQSPETRKKLLAFLRMDPQNQVTFYNNKLRQQKWEEKPLREKILKESVDQAYSNEKKAAVVFRYMEEKKRMDKQRAKVPYANNIK